MTVTVNFISLAQFGVFYLLGFFDYSLLCDQGYKFRPSLMIMVFVSHSILLFRLDLSFLVLSFVNVALHYAVVSMKNSVKYFQSYVDDMHLRG